MRAGVDRVYTPAGGLDRRRNGALDRGIFRPSKISATDPRLIGHDDDRNPQPVGARDEAHPLGNHPHLIGPGQIGNLLDDGAVAIEEQGGSRHTGDPRRPQIAPQPAIIHPIPELLGNHRPSGT